MTWHMYLQLASVGVFAVAAYLRERGRPLDRVTGPDGVRIDVPVLDLGTVDPAALALRPHER